MPRFVLLAILFILAGASAEAAEIVLRPEATVTGGLVRLADVADLGKAEGVDAALASVILCPAPRVGQQRILRRSEVLELLALSDVELSQLTLTGAQEVVVRRSERAGGSRHTKQSGTGTVPDKVEHALVSYLEAQEPGELDWSVTPAVPSRYLGPLQDAERITVGGGLKPFTGRQSFEIIARIDGHDRRIPIEAQVAALLPAAVAVRPIAKGVVIQADDIEVQPLSPESADHERLLASKEVIGREARTAIGAGQPISADAVQLPRLVRRGDKVSVRSLAAGVSITTSGKALADGAQGESIPVELEDPKRQIIARVTGPARVEIGTSQQPAAKTTPLKPAVVAAPESTQP